MQADFSRHVQALADETSRELNAADIWGAFERAYLSGGRFALGDYEETRAANGDRIFAGKLIVDGAAQSVSGRGNGLISSVVAAIGELGVALDVVDYTEHTLGTASDAQAAAYVECRTAGGKTVWGVGIDEDVATASVRAVLAAANSAI
jgi:2-isopropylmalate synthase